MYTPTDEKWPGVDSVATRILLGKVVICAGLTFEQSKALNKHSYWVLALTSVPREKARLDTGF